MNLHWEWSTLLLFVTYCFCFRRLGRPSSDSWTILDVPAEHHFFFDFVTFVQQIAASGHLLCRHTHSYYYAQQIVVPSRTLWQWNTAFLRDKSLKSKRNPSNSCDSTCQQSISFRLSLWQSVSQWPYNLTSYAFILLYSIKFPYRSL